MNNLLDKKITAKILSVLLATMFWIYVITEQNPVVYKDIALPVKLVNVESLATNNITMMNKNDYKISLKLKGNKNTLDRINNSTITATADLRDQKTKGEFLVPVQISGVPSGVDIISMSSGSIKVNMDNVISITMPVIIKVTGNPLQGMAAMTPAVSPTEVTIRGAETLVNLIKTAVVDLDISSFSTEVKKNIMVQIQDGDGKAVEDVEVYPKSVDVRIPIEYTKIVLLDPDFVVKPAPGYIVTGVSVNPKEIHITGKKELLDTLTSVKTERIELSDAKAFVDQEVALILPPGVELANKSEIIRLNANIEKIIEKPIETNNISIRNLSDDLDAEVQQTLIGAFVRGPESIVNAWDINKAFYIEALGLDEGTHTLQIFYDKPEELEVMGVNPNVVNITIKKKE
ncbi:MAG: CdaR family protein [Lutispora sp.]|nr:CdaR family protein [Lutispora sp.]MDD4833612.1 CdaR family protein [Lutispora sp.]